MRHTLSPQYWVGVASNSVALHCACMYVQDYDASSVVASVAARRDFFLVAKSKRNTVQLFLVLFSFSSSNDFFIVFVAFDSCLYSL